MDPSDFPDDLDEREPLNTEIDTKAIEDAVLKMLHAFGEDPEREGLKNTPKRVARMFPELLGGYRDDPQKLVNGALFTVDYDDMVIVRGVNVYPSQVEALLVGMPGIAPHYQLVLERRGSLDRVTLEVEAARDAAPHTWPAIAYAASHHLKSMIGLTVEVDVKAPGAVPRSQGKAVRVRDLRPKGDPS